MIQRIQTIYLLLTVALGILLACVPVVELITPENAPLQRMWELGATGLDEVTPNADLLCVEPATLNGWWGLTLATLLIPFLALVDIFLYRNRLLQARLNIFTVLLCLGYYGVLAIMIWFAKMNLDTDWHIEFWACIPLVCLVLTMMATRRILKDEALVRAADRIR